MFYPYLEVYPNSFLTHFWLSRISHFLNGACWLDPSFCACFVGHSWRNNEGQKVTAWSPSDTKHWILMDQHWLPLGHAWRAKRAMVGRVWFVTPALDGWTTCGAMALPVTECCSCKWNEFLKLLTGSTRTGGIKLSCPNKQWLLALHGSLKTEQWRYWFHSSTASMLHEHEASVNRAQNVRKPWHRPEPPWRPTSNESCAHDSQKGFRSFKIKCRKAWVGHSRRLQKTILQSVEHNQKRYQNLASQVLRHKSRAGWDNMAKTLNPRKKIIFGPVWHSGFAFRSLWSEHGKETHSFSHGTFPRKQQQKGQQTIIIFWPTMPLFNQKAFHFCRKTHVLQWGTSLFPFDELTTGQRKLISTRTRDTSFSHALVPQTASFSRKWAVRPIM